MLNSENTVASIKRFMGASSTERREESERAPFKAPSVTDVEIDIPSFLRED